jgi:hypothetical protein
MKSGNTSAEQYGRLWATITSGNVWEGEFHNRKKNGELFWEYATISPLKNRKGVITHYIAIKEDITERKKLEEQLACQKMSGRHLAADYMFQQHPTAIMVSGYAERSAATSGAEILSAADRPPTHPIRYLRRSSRWMRWRT